MHVPGVNQSLEVVLAVHSNEVLNSGTESDAVLAVENYHFDNVIMHRALSFSPKQCVSVAGKYIVASITEEISKSNPNSLFLYR